MSINAENDSGGTRLAAASTCGSTSVVMRAPEAIARELAEKTVAVRLAAAGKPYIRADLQKLVVDAVGAGALEAIGQREMSLHWELTFRSVEKKNQFLASAKQFFVKGVEAEVGGVRAGTCRMRVFYLPFYVPVTVITEKLKDLGARNIVATMERDRNEEGLCTNVRRIAISIEDANVVPDEMTWEFDGMSGKVLINVLGRPVKCMRCGVRGHRRFECTAPYCQVCREVGHTKSKTCKSKKSYARVAAGATADDAEEAENNSDMEMDGEEDAETEDLQQQTEKEGETTTGTPPTPAATGQPPDAATPSTALHTPAGEPADSWAVQMEKVAPVVPPTRPLPTGPSTTAEKPHGIDVDGSSTPATSEIGRKRGISSVTPSESVVKGRRLSTGEVPLDPTAGRVNSKLPVRPGSANRQDGKGRKSVAAVQ